MQEFFSIGTAGGSDLLLEAQQGAHTPPALLEQTTHMPLLACKLNLDFSRNTYVARLTVLKHLAHSISVAY